MTYKGDPIAEKLDKLAAATGVPRLSRGVERALPIRFRVLPLLMLALAVVGLAVQIWGNEWLGLWPILIAWTVTISLQQMGPLRQPRAGSRYDEREAALVRNGHFVGLMWAFGVAVLGALAIAIGKIGAMIRLWDIWAPVSGMDWMAVTFFLLTLEFNVALLAASAATPDPLDDGED